MPETYGQAYFDKYVGYSRTEVGRKLLEARLALVRKYVPANTLVDVGIGCGSFVEACDCMGYDVGPPMVAWLVKRGRFVEATTQPVHHATCWDSLEHMQSPHRLIENVRDFLFVSIPIFKDKAHVLRSKHFRTDEHYWYFTESAFLSLLSISGFDCLEQNRMEERCGREDIGTYVFRRRDPHAYPSRT